MSQSLSQSFDIQDFHHSQDLGECEYAIVPESIREPLRESNIGVREPNSESDLYCCDRSLEQDIFTAEDLADRFDTSTRTIQKRFERITAAYYWIPLENLRIGKGKETRYTRISIGLLESLHNRPEGQTEKQWVEQVHRDNSPLSLENSELKPASTSQSPPSPEESQPAALSSGQSTAVPSSSALGGTLSVVGAGTMEVHTVPANKIEVLQGFIASKKPQPQSPINLNGTAELGTDRAIALMDMIQQRRQQTDAVLDHLFQREHSVSTTEKAIDVLEQELEQQHQLEQAAIAKAHELKEREADASQRLGKLEQQSQR